MRWFRRMPVLHIAEERGEGPTVLLLHGIASSSVTFHHVIPLLERTHRCITPAGAAELTGLATRRTQLEGEQHKLLQPEREAGRTSGKT